VESIGFNTLEVHVDKVVILDYLLRWKLKVNLLHNE